MQSSSSACSSAHPVIQRDEVAVGRVDDFPIGEFRILQLSGREIGILRTGSGRFYAMRNSCPHRGAPICNGIIDGTMLPSRPGQLVFGYQEEIVRCPWHAFEFRLETGECLFIGYRKRVTVYPVRVDDAIVRVSLRQAGARPAEAETVSP